MDRIARLAPLPGLAAAVLFAVGSALWGFEQPAKDASSEELIAFYEDTSTAIKVGGTISIVSFAFLVWFGAVLKNVLDSAEGSTRSGLGLTAFAGTVLTAGVGLAAETINMAGAFSADEGQLTADTAQVYFDVSWAFGSPAAGVAIAMIAVPVAVTSLRTGRLLRPWSAWLGLILAVVLLTPMMWTASFQYPAALAVILLAGLSVRIYKRPVKVA